MLRLAFLTTAVIASVAPAEVTPLPAAPAVVGLTRETPSPLQFSIGRRPDGQAQLSVTYPARGGRGETSGPQPWSALIGFDAATLDHTTPTPVTLHLDRQAGDIHCSGTARQGRAAGDCRFDPDADFAGMLSRRIGSTPAAADLFHLALSDFHLETLDEMDRQGYAAPTVRELLAISLHGVDAAYVRGLAAAGYRLGRADTLVAFRIHDVTPAYIAAMAELGPQWRNLPARQITTLSLHGVSPDDLRAFAAAGLAPTPEQAVALSIHDVTPGDIRVLAEAGYPNLTIRQRLAFAVHEVTPGFIREMREAGYRNLSPEQLVALRIQGVDSDYARRLGRALNTRP